MFGLRISILQVLLAEKEFNRRRICKSFFVINVV